jgi:thiamine-monophosphate kinase
MSQTPPHSNHDSPPPIEPSSEGGEAAFLAWVRRRQEAGFAGNRPGDDLAVLDWPGGLVLLGVDPVLDGVHVDVSRDGFAAAGRKAMNRNLSDVAAMAGEPVAATVSLVVPHPTSLAEVQEVYLGAETAGLEAGCPIVGGDFASWEGRLVVTVGILGRTRHPVLRGTAQPGQTLFVTGPLGGSILGRHLTFKPRLAMGLRAAGEFRASAMIDLSDGLSRDLPRLLGPNVGATVNASSVPIHPDASALARQTGREALWHALNDGEDYELLFAADAEDLAGCTAIGRVDPQPGVRLERGGQVQVMTVEGWEHRLGGGRGAR